MDEYIEQAYMTELLKEGLAEEVVLLFKELAMLNERSLTYFVIEALEDFAIQMNQEADFFAAHAPSVH
tara:strand:- start:62 stop:265 length:204 start_codon:yes stop_codon:yes gene_type:complete